MARYAVIRNGQVVNVIAWDGGDAWKAPDDHVTQIIPDDVSCGPGYQFDGINFNAPESMFPVCVESEAPEEKIELPTPDPLTYNAIGYTTVAQGPLTTGARCAVDGKPGLWLIGDRIPGVEGYSITRVA